VYSVVVHEAIVLTQKISVTPGWGQAHAVRAHARDRIDDLHFSSMFKLLQYFKAGGSRTNLSALHVFDFFEQGIAPILRKQLPKHVNSGMQLIYNAAIGILPAKLVPLCERHSSSMYI
jgi:hypothetical protein